MTVFDPLRTLGFAAKSPEAMGAKAIPKSVRKILEASKGRALATVMVPFAYPLILAWGLSTSGHSIADYPALLASGELSLIRQASGWIATIGFACVYGPAAISALTARYFVGASEQSLFVPSGEEFAISTIKSISLRKGFWHRYMCIRAGEVDRTFNVTFARKRLAEIKQALEGDPNLRGVAVS